MAAQEIGSLYLGLGFDTAVFDRQIVQIPQKVNQATESIKKGFQAAGTHLDRFQVSTGATRNAVQNLTFQLNDIGTSLASGGSPFRVLAQQGGQIVQVFQQGGGVRSVLGAFAVSLRGLITPTTAAVAGIAAVGVAIGVLTARAVENSGAMRQFSVMLKGLGLEGQATAAGLDEAAKRLKDVGLSASEARAALTAATRAGIAPGQAERVVRTGQNLIPVLGADAPQQFISAIAGGIEPLAKIARQLGLISAAEVEAAREAAKFGQELSFIDRWVRLIEQKTKGLNDEALSPMGRAMRELTKSFNEMLDAASRSDLIQGLVNGLNAMARVLKTLFELQSPDWFNQLMGVGGGGRTFTAKIPPVAGTGADAAGGAAPIPPASALSLDQLVQAVKQVESRGNPNAVSSKGAMGLMQLMPGTAARFGVRDPFNPTENVRGGTEYLQYLLKHYDGDVEKALMAYNWGEGNLDKALKAGREIPAGVKAYAGKVIAAAGGGSGSVFGRPGASREDFMAGRTEDFEREFEETSRGIKATRNVAEGYRISPREGAGRVDQTQALLEGATRFGDAGLDQALVTRRTLQLADVRRAGTERRFAEAGAEERQRTEQLQKQASLFGQSTEEIERQIALLKIRQEAEAVGLSLTDELVKAREAEASALADANDLLRRQQSLMTQMREIAGVFENAFSQAFDSIAAGTFRARAFIGSLLRDLGKALASQAFRKLLGTDDSGGGGLLGMVAGKLFGIGGLGGGDRGPGAGDFGGGGDVVPAFAGGGSFAVGGSGGIDSQLVAFHASPGEMVDVSPSGQRGRGGEDVLYINLNPSEGWVAGVADQRITTRSGQIVSLAVTQTTKHVARNFSNISSEAQARSL